MRTFLFGTAMICAMAMTPARAEVSATIDLSTQHMHVQSASGTYDWPVSTARAGYVTPTGSFRAEHLELMHHSKKWDNAPMPHSVFFYYGFAIHGTNEVRHLGHPASHGCVRLSPANAAKFYSMVEAEGASITITGTPPGGTAFAVADSGAPQKSVFSWLGF